MEEVAKPEVTAVTVGPSLPLMEDPVKPPVVVEAPKMRVALPGRAMEVFKLEPLANLGSGVPEVSRPSPVAAEAAVAGMAVAVAAPMTTPAAPMAEVAVAAPPTQTPNT